MIHYISKHSFAITEVEHLINAKPVTQLVAYALWNGFAVGLLCALLSVNTHQLRFRASHNDVGLTGKSKGIKNRP